MPVRDAAPASVSATSPIAPGADASVTVSVLYFAALRELAGRAEESVSVTATERVDVGTLLAALEVRHDPLRGRLGSVRVAVNEEFAPLSTELRGGEVIALIPPVSGG